MPEFDQAYWDAHWRGAGPAGLPPHPALVSELADLAPGTALDAGPGAGAEAGWLAARGWAVTAVDISAPALDRATRTNGAGSITWLRADLTTWAPQRPFDLVVTCYAHPTIGQHAFYRRIAGWVAPGGTLFIVGHHHEPAHGHADHGHPAAAVTAPEQIAALLDRDGWTVQTAAEMDRAVADPHGQVRALRDVVVRARRG